MSTPQFQHVGISVADLDRAVAWYRENFGFEEIKRFDKPELEIRGAAMKLNDHTLEVLQPYTPAPAHAPGDGLTGALRALGANHLAIAVDNIAECLDRFRSRNVRIVGELIDGRFFFCTDPDGTLIEVRQGG